MMVTCESPKEEGKKKYNKKKGYGVIKKNMCLHLTERNYLILI